MSAILLATLAALGAPPSDLSAADAHEQVEEARSFHNIHNDIHDAKCAESAAECPEDRELAIYSLCGLHYEIANHPRFVDSRILQGYRASVARRLVRVQRAIEAELAQSEAADKDEDEEAGEFAGGTEEDYGQELVELIQRTIAPDQWDVVGGPYTIVYFAPRQALVVRASSEMHESLRRFAGDLRAAGQ